MIMVSQFLMIRIILKLELYLRRNLRIFFKQNGRKTRIINQMLSIQK
nr:MAG TPA: hypothetical protein [Caudoviricetes sp.]